MIGTGHRPQRIPTICTTFGRLIVERDRACWALFCLSPCGCRDIKSFGPEARLSDALGGMDMFLVQPMDPT